MNDLPIRRWHPGYLAMRWRHLLWSVPTLALLAGLLVHFLPMIRNTATGVVQVRAVRSSTSGLPLFALSEIAGAVESDKVLRDITLAAGLQGRWKMEGEECVAELRDAIDCNAIPGTSLVEISVSSGSRSESMLIWDALVNALKDHFRGIRRGDEQATLDSIKAQIDLLEADVETKRQALRRMIRTHDLLHRPNAEPFSETTDFTMAKVEFEKAQAVLEAAKIKLISEQMLLKIQEDPLIVHEAPGTHVPVTLWDRLRPLVVHASLGLAAGMVFAVVLAYLLELLFPRKVTSL